MRRVLNTAYALGALTGCVFTADVSSVRAQDIQPRATPTRRSGVNFLIAGYANTRGALESTRHWS